MPADRIALGLALTLAASLVASPAFAGVQSDAPESVVLRMMADTGVVGHYSFTTQETHQLSFEVPEGDPRAQLLASATAVRSRETKIAATIVSFSREDEDRRYLIYWLGYSVDGDDVTSLTPIQWDSIFQTSGRRALLRVSATGEPKGVEVTSDAVKPVGQAFAVMLSSLAVKLPEGAVSEGSTWQGDVAVPVRRPDGSRTLTPISVTYRLRQLIDEPEARIARIEFDGAPAATPGLEATGRYFGEMVFDATAGRFDDLMALAEIEVEWPAGDTGLPASRSLTRWQGFATRSRTEP